MDFREMTKASLQDCLDRILDTYMKLYDIEHSDKEYDRNAVELKEIIDWIDILTAPSYVYARDGQVNESYVLEKLNRIRNNLNYKIRYYEEELYTKHPELRPEE